MNKTDFLSLLEKYIQSMEKLQSISAEHIRYIDELLQLIRIMETENECLDGDILASCYDELVDFCDRLREQSYFYSEKILEAYSYKNSQEACSSLQVSCLIASEPLSESSPFLSISSTSSKDSNEKQRPYKTLQNSNSYSSSNSSNSSKNSYEEKRPYKTPQNACNASSTKTQPDAHLPNALPVSKVYFSAVAPRIFNSGKRGLINVFMYEAAFRSVVDEVIDNADDPVREHKFSPAKVSDNTSVRIELTSDDLPIEDNCVTQEWMGEYLRFSFSVLVPESYRKEEITFRATVYFNGVMASMLHFQAKCGINSSQRIPVQQKNILSAFMSYASQDRARVIAIIQGMKKARKDLDIFFDVESLRSGEDWEKNIYREIDQRDVLFLCWSHFANESVWVDKEWRYAYAHKGADFIEPIPMESPKQCKPPAELQNKHFNDHLLYLADV